MSVRLDQCVTFEESPDDGIYMRRLTPADILAAVRTLPGVTTAETVMDHKQWYIPMDEPGTYLLVPLSEEE